MLTKSQMTSLLKKWYEDWNRHDLDQVMALFHHDIVFIHWTGQSIIGKKNLERAWRPWFQNHDDFSFTELETIVDEDQQKALFRWILDWVPPTRTNKNEHVREKREGIDLLHFSNNEIIKKLTYSKTMNWIS